MLEQLKNTAVLDNYRFLFIISSENLSVAVNQQERLKMTELDEKTIQVNVKDVQNLVDRLRYEIESGTKSVLTVRRQEAPGVQSATFDVVNFFNSQFEKQHGETPIKFNPVDISQIVED